MKIFTRPLLLTSVIFLLDLVDIICSEPDTLEDLFPGYNGIMPLVENFRRDIPKLQTYGDKPMIFSYAPLVNRGHIIFGVYSPLFISDLFRIFRSLQPTFFVFDLNKDEWVTVPRNLTRKLGANRYFPLLVARDEVAARHVTTSKNKVYKEAHIIACREANEKVDIVEQEQLELVGEDLTNMEDVIVKIKEEYSQAYDRAFTRHLYQHGEYNLNGHRERHA